MGSRQLKCQIGSDAGPAGTSLLNTAVKLETGSRYLPLLDVCMRRPDRLIDMRDTVWIEDLTVLEV